MLGCDIDSEAVAWCRGNLAGAEFTHIGTDPPAPYPDASVDLVIACSVFTHLASADQAAWLRELHRVTAPGALVLASVHGDYAFRLDQGWGRPAGRLAAARARLRRRGRSATLKRRGWLDSGEDPSLGEAAPKGYYRTVYQTRRHTIDSWGRQFEIVDYVERGLNGHQDLVVMRRR